MSPWPAGGGMGEKGATRRMHYDRGCVNKDQDLGDRDRGEPG